MMTRIWLIGAALLVITTGGYFLIQRIQDTGKQELKIEQLQEQIQTRERIDNAVRNSPSTSDGAVELLNDFINSRD